MWGSDTEVMHHKEILVIPKDMLGFSMLLQRHLVLQRGLMQIYGTVLLMKTENYNKLLYTNHYQLLLKEALSTWAAKSWSWQILFSVCLSDALQEL